MSSAVAIVIGGAAVCVIAMVGAASTSSRDVASVAAHTSKVPTATTTTTTDVLPSRDAASDTGRTQPSSSTTTTATTIAPMVTHLADISVLAPTPVAAPTRVIIAALDIDGPVIPGGVNAASELDVPRDARTLVWYRHGPSPGAPGSAVIAGHLNWRGTTGLFARLDEIPLGATITVVYDDGSQQDFIASTVELVSKPAVAVNGIFARQGEPLLRLITCGGEFEKKVRSYRSNVVVTAIPA